MEGLVAFIKASVPDAAGALRNALESAQLAHYMYVCDSTLVFFKSLQAKLNAGDEESEEDEEAKEEDRAAYVSQCVTGIESIIGFIRENMSDQWNEAEAEQLKYLTDTCALALAVLGPEAASEEAASEEAASEEEAGGSSSTPPTPPTPPHRGGGV